MPEQNQQPLGLHILVAEDNKVNQMVVQKLLQKLGCSSAVANDGVECIDMLAKDHYDMILMDCMMPNMDGFEATQQIRASGNADLPIIACTAKAMDTDHQACLEAGMNDFIDKPVDMNRMKALLIHWAEQLGKI